VAIVGLVPTAIAYVLYLTGLRLIDATKASVFALMEPVAAAALGFLFLQERLSYDSMVGFAMIISSIVLLSLQSGDSSSRRFRRRIGSTLSSNLNS